MSDQSEAPIESFAGEFRFLSNFWPADVKLDGMTFRTVEHAYQAAKTNDIEERAAIQALDSPGQAKRAGRKVRMRPDWEVVKVKIMTELVTQKFTSQPLRAKLLTTGDRILIEGNTWNDRFWGVCNGSGRNVLGHILMGVREEARVGG